MMLTRDNAVVITTRCARYFGVDAQDIWGHSRRREHVRARHCAWAIMAYQGWTCSEIGRMFDRDHSSIHYAVQVTRKRYDLNAVMRAA